MQVTNQAYNYGLFPTIPCCLATVCHTKILIAQSGVALGQGEAHHKNNLIIDYISGNCNTLDLEQLLLLSSVEEDLYQSLPNFTILSLELLKAVMDFSQFASFYTRNYSARFRIVDSTEHKSLKTIFLQSDYLQWNTV